MATCFHLEVLAIFALLPVLGSGETCLSPQVTSQVYTTTEATVSSETAVIIEFSLTCKNGARDLNVYAEFNGRTFPASRAEDSKNFQISWSDEHKKIAAGKHTVRFFDEEAYADLRKAQRSGEDTASVKSLFTIDFTHNGATQSLWVQSEFVAALVAILVVYLAHNARTKLS